MLPTPVCEVKKYTVTTQTHAHTHKHNLFQFTKPFSAKHDKYKQIIFVSVYVDASVH